MAKRAALLRPAAQEIVPMPDFNFSRIHYERDGHIARITINRPDA